MPWPMPEVEPVISAVRPLSVCSMGLPFLCLEGGINAQGRRLSKPTMRLTIGESSFGV